MIEQTNGSPTKERRRQNGGVFAELIRRDPEGHSLIKRYRAVWECPLDAYKDFGLINAQEYRAGLKFRRIYYATVICRAINDHERVFGGDTQVANHERALKSAFQILPSHDKEAVIDICGHNQPARSPRMLDALKKGLGHLALKWNMVAIEVCEHKRNEKENFLALDVQ
jgi:hypothetical protein